MWPTMAVSTIESNGTDMFVTTAGKEMRAICSAIFRREGFKELLQLVSIVCSPDNGSQSGECKITKYTRHCIGRTC